LADPQTVEGLHHQEPGAPGQPLAARIHHHRAAVHAARLRRPSFPALDFAKSR